MKYSKPVVNLVPKFQQVAESQYNVIVGIDPSDGCPDLELDQATLSGTASMELNYTIVFSFASQGTCNATASVSGEVTVQNGVILTDCSSLDDSCSLVCQETSLPTSAEICVTSFVLNGEAQDVGGTCFTVDGVAAGILYNDGPCD
jgi:hypothetical protein